MIINFKHTKKNGEIKWRFKGEDRTIKVKNAKIVRNFEYLEKIFIIRIEDNTTVLYIYDAEGQLYDKYVSTKEFFISGIRGGIIEPEIVVKSENNPTYIYIYKAKQKKFENTLEIVGG